MLALNANRVTAVEQLVDAVWDIDPPATARVQIQICISALRRLLAENGCPARIVTCLPGYRLEVDHDHLDSSRFSALIDKAREHEDDDQLTDALVALRAALGLWRGAVLADVYSDLVRRISARLSERRVTAEVSSLRIELALGRTSEIIPDLRALIDDHPLREEVYGYLMLALYRSGRQTEALEVYRKARTVLVEEVGLEPSDELRDLERAILNRDENLRLPAPSRDAVTVGVRRDSGRFVVPSQLPSGIGELTGRDEFVEQITRVLSFRSGLRPGAWPVVAISGRGGVGKSSLAVHTAHKLVSSYPDGQLYADMTDRGDGRVSNVLHRFLRALGVPASAVPDGDGERAEMYRSLLANQRMIILLDGVSSEEQVFPLLPGASTCAVIVSSRSRLSGLSGAHFVHLTELDADQSRQFLNRLISEERVRAEPEAVAELVERCERLPLAMSLAAARLNAKPHWKISHFISKLADESRMLDELSHGTLELRSSMALTYRALSPVGQRLFRLLALIDANGFATWEAAALLDSDLATAEGVLEELVDAHVIEVTDAGTAESTGYRFHELVRAYAREKVAISESLAEHESAIDRWLGAWLARVEHVHRKEYGGDYLVLHGNAHRWHAPAGSPTGMDGFDLATLDRERSQLIGAIRQAADSGKCELSWDLMMSSITLFEAKGCFDDWREAALLARGAVERANNRRGRAAVHYALGALQLAKNYPVEATKEFSIALELFVQEGDKHGRGLVLRNLAFIDRLRGDYSEMLSKYNEALVIMRAVGDRMGEAQILCNVAKHRLAEGDETHGRSLLEEALAISVDAGCRRGEAQALCALADLHICNRDRDQADTALGRALRIMRDLGDLSGEAHVMYGISVVRQMEGRSDHAEVVLKHALARAREVGERQIEAQTLYRLAELLLSRDEVSAARMCCTEALQLCGELDAGLWRARMLILSSEIHASGGATDLARADASRALDLLRKQTTQEAQALRSRARQSLAILRVDDAVDGNAAFR